MPDDTNGPNPLSPTPPGGGQHWPAEVLAAFQAMTARHQEDMRAVAMQLYDENYRYRAQVRELKTEVDTLSGRAAPEGGVTLTAEEARAWQAYRALGDVEGIAARLAEGEAWQEEKARLTRQRLLGEAAEAHGYKAAVLERLVGDEQIELREVTGEDGGKVRVAYVLGEGGAGAEGGAGGGAANAMPLSDYARQTWPDFLPSLRQGTENGNSFKNQTGTEAVSRPNSTKFVPQAGGGTAPQKQSVVQGYLKRAYQDRQEK